MAARARNMPSQMLEQLVTRIQRHSGRNREDCWRLVVQYGVKRSVEYRRWTDAELDEAREQLVNESVQEVARRLNRTPKAIRSKLCRNQLSVRSIRCDLFSVYSLSKLLRVRKAEVLYWIEQKWLAATIGSDGRRNCYFVTPEALQDLYRNHHGALLERGLPNHLLFQAYIDYCFSPRHTDGPQLLDVRRHKRERSYLGKEEPLEDDGEQEDEEQEELEPEEVGTGIRILSRHPLDPGPEELDSGD